MKTDLAITGVGMMTPVGLSAYASMHSVRSGISRLTVQHIPDHIREWVVGGRIFAWTATQRARRLQSLAEHALERAWHQAGAKSDPSAGRPVALLLGAPEAFRPGYRFPAPDLDLPAWLKRRGITPGHCESLPAGAASVHVALQRAAEILASGAGAACIVGVTDSQLQLRVTRWHEANYRLKCSYLTDGLMPGEASCFLVVEQVSQALSRGANLIAHIGSVVCTQEAATILSDEPNTALALSKAVREAMEDAAINAHQIDTVWSDLNGESYRAREWALTEVRLGFSTNTHLLHPADCFGDAGAASGASLICHAALSCATGWTRGGHALAFAGSDNGLRGVAVMLPLQTQGPFLQVTNGQPAVLSSTFRIPHDADATTAAGGSDDPVRDYFETQLYEEHRDELAALYYQRRSLLADTSESWPRLREPEQRILNHLDAAVAAGPRSMANLAAAIHSEEEGMGFAGGMLIAVLPSEDNLALLGRTLESAPESTLAGITGALRHAPASQTLDRIIATWTMHDRPSVRAMAVMLAGNRRVGLTQEIQSATKDPDPEVLVAAAGACWRVANADALTELRMMLNHPGMSVRNAAWMAIYCLRPEATLRYIRQQNSKGESFTPEMRLILGMGGDPADAALIAAGADANEVRPGALRALGVLGSPHSIPLLIESLSGNTDEIVEAAAHACRFILGEDLRERVTRTSTIDLGGGETITEQTEVERVCTKPQAWEEVWAKRRNELAGVARWRLGRAYSMSNLVEGLADPICSYPERQQTYTELVAHSRLSIPFEADWFVERQLAAISAWRTAVAGK